VRDADQVDHVITDHRFARCWSPCSRLVRVWHLQWLKRPNELSNHLTHVAQLISRRSVTDQ